MIYMQKVIVFRLNLRRLIFGEYLLVFLVFYKKSTEVFYILIFFF